MANDLFGGLSGLMKGFSNFMPQDDPDVKLMNAQTQISDLKNQESALYAEIGKQALTRGSGQYPELEGKLKLVQDNLLEAQAKLKAAQAEKDHKEQEKHLAQEQSTCPKCGFLNQEGIKFCQECGAKLRVNAVCPGCGAKLVPGVRFCGECGSRIEG